jgi:hypothetical protein
MVLRVFKQSLKIIGCIMLYIFISAIVFVVSSEYFSKQNTEKFYKNIQLEDEHKYDNHLELPDHKINYNYRWDQSYPTRKESDAIKITSWPKLKRNTYIFDTLLIKYPYNNIVFKNEENWTLEFNSNSEVTQNPLLDNDTDMYMLPSLAEKINEVQQSISDIGERFVIRVTDSYDNNNEHRNERNFPSMHYSGRAVDVTIYDTMKNIARYDLLPLLYDICVELDFDFVYYHRYSHIHLSEAPQKINNTIAKVWTNNNIENDNKEDIVAMKPDNQGWFTEAITLNKGVYFISFQTDGYEYGRIDEETLSRSDNMSFFEPIVIQINKKATVKLTFNPYFLKYKIIANKGVEIINNKDINLIGKETEDNNSHLR